MRDVGTAWLSSLKRANEEKERDGPCSHRVGRLSGGGTENAVMAWQPIFLGKNSSYFHCIRWHNPPAHRRRLMPGLLQGREEKQGMVRPDTTDFATVLCNPAL